MKTFGLSQADYNFLSQTVILPLQKAGVKVYAFGSRVTGKHHPFSDLDLLLETPDQFDSQLFYKVKDQIEESNFPIKIDFVFSDQLASSYKEHVYQQRVLIP